MCIRDRECCTSRSPPDRPARCLLRSALLRCVSRSGRTRPTSLSAMNRRHVRETPAHFGIGPRSTTQVVELSSRSLHESPFIDRVYTCLLYTSDAADDLTRVDLGGR